MIDEPDNYNELVIDLSPDKAVFKWQLDKQNKNKSLYSRMKSG